MEDSVPFASRVYFGMLGILVFARGMDFLSTWIATPHLVLEGNPLAKWLGWKWGAVVNALFCGAFALLPLPALVLSTTSVLVAARNFQQAWLMRSLGEELYRDWHVARLQETRMPMFIFCLFGQTALTAGLGAGLIYFSPQDSLAPVAVGFGIVGYAVAVAFYTLLAVWRIRRAMD
jgi:hypothetical protein